MNQKNKPRYSFLRVSVVVVGFYILLGILALSVIAVTPGVPAFSLEHFLNWKNLLTQFTSIAFSCGFYYFLINEYYRLLSERKPTVRYIIPSLVAFLSLAVFYTMYQLFLADRIMNITVNNKIQPVPLAMLILSYGVSAVFLMVVSFLAAYLTRLRDDRKEKKILEEQALQLEAEKSNANLNFLKAQINPHFLHNTLNFLYAKSLPLSEELSEGILILSEIMRYALNQNTAIDHKVPLDDELEHMQNVIRINQLRFGNRLKIDLKTEGQTAGARIIPFVLITLVENAFKHGDLTQPENPLTIRVRMDQHGLYFYSRNKKKSGLKELSTGIGLDNIKKRLELVYGNDANLILNDEGDFYTTELKIMKP